MPIASVQYGEILSVIDGLYAATLDPAQWQPFLGRAAALLRADNAYVSHIQHDTGDLEYIVLRPMNCPHHMMVFKSEMRSYRDLPVRVAELSNVRALWSMQKTVRYALRGMPEVNS